jgi:DNA-binding transcriptional regulator GbsR (MarR family)
MDNVIVNVFKNGGNPMNITEIENSFEAIWKQNYSKTNRDLVNTSEKEVMEKLKELLIQLEKKLPSLPHAALRKYQKMEKNYKKLKTRFAYIRRWHNAIYKTNAEE